MENNFIVKDISLADKGIQLIEWVSKWMPVLDNLYGKYKSDNVFKNKKVALCIHLEAKTAYLALTIKKLGAEVWVTSSNTLSTKDEVAASLAVKGIHVYAKHAASHKEYWSYLETILKNNMDIVVDDGGDICEYLHNNIQYGKNLRGICEETTTGVNRLKKLEKSGKLLYPSIAVNDAKSKHLFDNRYGTGQSTWTAITQLTNMNIAGKTVVLAGYGWVGRGVAARAQGMGASVIVTEIDPWKALEAKMDGHRVMQMIEAAPLGDFFVTTTGFSKIIKMEHILRMKNGAFLSNAGHFDFEIDIQALKKHAKSFSVVRDEVEEYVLTNNKKVYLLARGGIINIAGGLGHPADIMDLSFSVQLGCLHYLLSKKNLQPIVYKVPEEIDRLVTEEKLKVEGIKIDK
jgi:adenosylhomocysteinase